MREQLEIKYGELMQLRDTCADYLLRNQYNDKMDAIITLLQPMHYKAVNPITEE